MNLNKSDGFELWPARNVSPEKVNVVSRIYVNLCELNETLEESKLLVDSQIMNNFMCKWFYLYENITDAQQIHKQNAICGT